MKEFKVGQYVRVIDMPEIFGEVTHVHYPGSPWMQFIGQDGGRRVYRDSELEECTTDGRLIPSCLHTEGDEEDEELMTRALIITAKKRPDEGEGSFGGGFYQPWIDGNNEEVEFTLNSGAGLGNQFLSLHVTFLDGKSFWEDINVTKLVTTWVNAILDERKN